MKELAEGVWRLHQFPRPIINVYLAGDVLIDAGSRGDKRRIFRQLAETEVGMVTLTHVHPDHQGAAKALCEARDIPLACPRGDVDAMEGRRPIMDHNPDALLNRLSAKMFAGPPHKVDRVLDEGDEIGDGFKVVDTPGHSRGHCTYFRERDRVAIAGDVVRNMTYVTTRTAILEPPVGFTSDVEENRRSIRKLAELEPKIILPGHGPAITDMRAFGQFVAAL